MCKYCTNTEEFTPFIDEEFDFLPKTKLLVNGGINEKMEFSIYGDYGMDLFYTKTNINYCPMCGRKLKNE